MQTTLKMFKGLSYIFWFGITLNHINSFAEDEDIPPEFHNQTLHQLVYLEKNPPDDIVIEMPSGNIKVSSESLIYQEKAVLLSMLGMEKEAQIEFETGMAKYESVESIANVTSAKQINHTQFDAISTIKNLAKSESVVMLNEAHHISLHRLFAIELAKELRKVGYTHIAAEALYDVPLIEKLGFPSTENGIYIRDPEFAQFIRQAQQIGFALVEYESNSLDREKGQAENLAKFMKNNPSAKVFVYAGYAHIKEQQASQTMAYYFKSITGIDPLTIDQVGGTSKINQAVNEGSYNYANKFIEEDSIVLKETKSDNWLVSDTYKNNVDITVFHPYEFSYDFSKYWLGKSSFRTPYNTSIEKSKSPQSIKALLESEWEAVNHQAIPVDQTMLNAGETEARLYLENGIYRVYLETQSDTDRLLERIKVKNGVIEKL